MRFHHKIFIALLSCLALAGCAEAVVKKVDYASMREIPESARPHPLKFSGIDILLPPGTEVGLEGGAGRFCSWPRYPVDRGLIHKSVDRKYIKQSFHDAMEANGYDVVDSIDIAFRPEDELQRAEYFIKARVKDIDLDTCRRSLAQFFGHYEQPGVKGKFYMQVDWSIYDALRRKVIFKTTTEGYTHRKIPNMEGMTLLFHDAFEMATHNLAANEDFYNLIVRGEEPASTAKSKNTYEDEARIFDPREAVDIAGQALSRQPLPKHIERARAAAVIIQKNGHGSGFFITEAGHILTNQHVVGDALNMRIITKGKRHKLIAEVLRVDKVHDVALLKIKDKPKSLKIKPLPIRTAKLGVSEDIYAIGTPADYKSLQDSVSKGIVSAHRIYKDDGIRLPFIQGDVQVHAGSSGGPLLDEYGNIAGMSVSGVSYTPLGFGTGLNFFVPIAEALRALDITIDGKRPSPYPTHPDEQEELSPDEAEEIPIDLLVE